MNKRDVTRIISDRLSRYRGAEYEIFHSRNKVLSIGVKDGHIDYFRTSRELGLALRVLHRGRLGFAYLFGPTPQSLIALADRAIELASQADVDPLYAFPQEEKMASTNLDIFDENLAVSHESDQIERVKEMEHAALSADPRIKKVRKAEYEELIGFVALTNSSGLDLERQGTRVAMSIMVLAEDNRSSEMGWEYKGARFYSDLDPGAIGLSAATRGIQMLGSRQISTRTCPAVLENRVVVDLLGVWASSFFGENVYKGKSRLKDKIDRTIASPGIQLIDDGLYPGGMGSAPFDDEGTPQRKSVLVKDGRLLSYLFDRYWSKRTGHQGTGNSVRAGVTSPPSTSASNLFISPGSLSLEELVHAAGDGFLIHEVMGVHTADPISGEFSLGASGMWIEKGAPAFPVKEVTISGTIHNLFSAVEGIGNDLRFPAGRIGAPSLLLREILVSGS
jgi:PmbA protein